MSHWFHRNPLKATTTVKFELKNHINNEFASKICRLNKIIFTFLYFRKLRIIETIV